MDDKTANKVIELTSQFYASEARSFSDTRAAAWEGWRKVLEVAQTHLDEPLCVLDIACGNLRFERFLAEANAQVQEVNTVDNCEPLAKIGLDGAESFPFSVRFENLDILQALAQGKNVSRETFSEHLGNSLNCSNFAVCFGFMHHIPKSEWRANFLRDLVKSVQEGGIVALSFWQFANSERILNKAREATARGAELYDISLQDENDYLLGWQDSQNALRYCHNYTDEEISALIASLPSAREIARFSADGKTGNLNRYVVLQT